MLMGTTGDLKVPAGTQPGTTLMMAKKGVPLVNKSNMRGDQLVRVQVEIPKWLSKEERELVEELAYMSMNTTAIVDEVRKKKKKVLTFVNWLFYSLLASSCNGSWTGTALKKQMEEDDNCSLLASSCDYFILCFKFSSGFKLCIVKILQLKTVFAFCLNHYYFFFFLKQKESGVSEARTLDLRITQ